MIPGFTGLPRADEPHVDRSDAQPRVEAADDVCARAVSWYSTRCRGIEVDAGTTTQGPARDADHEPVALVRATCRRGDGEGDSGNSDDAQRSSGLHGTLRKSIAEIVGGEEKRACDPREDVGDLAILLARAEPRAEILVDLAQALRVGRLRRRRLRTCCDLLERLGIPGARG